jgi:hypothetical protein
MNKLREAAQQALNALSCIEYSFCGITDGPSEDTTEAAITALRSALAEPDTCTWFQDGDSDSSMYQTSCRKYFDLTDGTPEDNKMQWCCYCGKKLVQELITEDSDE